MVFLASTGVILLQSLGRGSSFRIRNGQGFSIQRPRKALSEDKDNKIKGILVVQTDTASSMLLNVEEISKLNKV